MKKIVSLFVAVVFLSMPFLASAQEMNMSNMTGGGNQTGMMPGKMMCGKDGKCPCGMMMKHMMGPKQIVASDNGSVVVLAGNKLLKYDKDLNLIKETEIKADTADMSKMMEHCGMMGGVKQEEREGK